MFRRAQLAAPTSAASAAGSVGAAHDVDAQAAALAEAVRVAEATAHTAPDSVRWPGLAAQAHAELAELARARGDAKTATAEWRAADALLAPLAKAGRLPAPRQPLYARARAHARG